MVSCSSQTSEYSIYEMNTGNHKNEVSSEYEEVIEPDVEKNKTIVINDVLYELEYQYTNSTEFLSYKRDYYKVLNVDSLYEELTPFVVFVSGSECLSSTQSFIIKKGDGVDKNKDELKIIADEFISKYVDLNSYDFQDVDIADYTGNKYKYTFTYKKKVMGYFTNEVSNVIINNYGDITGISIGINNSFDGYISKDTKFNKDELKVVLENKLNDIYKDIKYDYVIKSEILYISKNNKIGILYNIDVSSNEFNEVCMLIIYLE